MQVIEIDQKLLLYKIIWDDDFFYGTNKNKISYISRTYILNI